MKRKVGFFFLFACIAAITLSAGLMAYNIWIENIAYEKAIMTAQALYEQIQNPKVMPGDDYYGELSVKNATPLIEISGEYYLGILNIPALSLKLPINSEYDDKRMEDSPCRYVGDLSGSLVICAHNYKRHFGGIKNLANGDIITITDATGYEHNYTVELVTTLHGSEVEAMINNPYDLTLFTCTKSRTDRVTVRCVKAEDETLDNETEAPIIADDPNAPNAPNFKIDYTHETIKLRKGYLYSMDGIDFTEITETSNIAIDVSASITKSAPIYIKKGAAGNRPISKTQIITPIARATLDSQVLTPANGALALDNKYEVYNPFTMKWGKLPKITANSALEIRLKSTANLAASLPGKLIITFDVYDSEKNKSGIVAAEIMS